ILVEHGGQWKSEEDPLPLLEMYTVAILCFAEATPFLFPECEHVTVVLEKLALTCLDFLLSLSVKVPDALWEEFQSSVKVAHGILQGNGNLQLSTLMALANESGVWTNATLCHILSNNLPDVEKVHELLAQEGPTLLDMRIKHLIKQKCVEKAAVLAKTCAEFPEFGGKKNFKQIYLVCLCETMSQQELMQEASIKEIDCKDALDMICNLESEENEKGALSLCTAFFKRQLLQGDVYCAWELTLFWSKLLIRLESAQAFLDQCRLLAQLSGSVYHILLLIKVIQAENDHKAIRVSADGDFESVDLTFKCEYEGCDRVYTTKSNLLRHFMKKHQTTFEPIKQKQKKGDAETESAKTLAAKPNDGKENISSNKIKLKKKSLKKKEEKARNHWTSFGKPSLKSMDEASAMCTGQFLLQYPCMIKGCDSVSSTERNIVKHYTTHGLTERYIENQRSHFIFCKKNSRLRNKEGGKSDDISSDITELGKADAYENTDPIETADHQQQVDPLEAVDSIQNTDSSQKADPQQNADPTRKTDFQQNAEPTQNTDPQQNTEPQQKADPANSMVNSQDPEPENGAPPKTEQLAFANCTSELIPVKRKRGRPRKSEQTLKINPQRKQSLRHTTTDINFVPKVSESTSNPAAHHQEQTESGVAQKLFSPLGFKASILKLFEEPPPTNTFKRKSSESDWTDKPLKRKQKNLNANSIYKNAVFLKKSEDQNMVHFRNPLKLESVNNVKIVMDGSFSNGADLLLKQLQDMRPTVILKKWLCS
ncbi:hypothetical protein QTP70_035260, partial [Hemibagrus guttatus]